MNYTFVVAAGALFLLAARLHFKEVGFIIEHLNSTDRFPLYLFCCVITVVVMAFVGFHNLKKLNNIVDITRVIGRTRLLIEQGIVFAAAACASSLGLYKTVLDIQMRDGFGLNYPVLQIVLGLYFYLMFFQSLKGDVVQEQLKRLKDGQSTFDPD